MIAACREAIRAQLMAGYDVANPTTGFPVFAFRLHQFLSRGDTVYASPEPAKSRYLTINRQRNLLGHPGVGTSEWNPQYFADSTVQ